MIAPCGIEIRVGQVWRSRYGKAPKDYWDGTVRAVGPDTDKVQVVQFHNGSWGLLTDFTNKRGGYCLVRDVEEAHE